MKFIIAYSGHVCQHFYYKCKSCKGKFLLKIKHILSFMSLHILTISVSVTIIVKQPGLFYSADAACHLMAGRRIFLSFGQ